VLRYFTSKAGLYVEVVREAIALLLERQRLADEALPATTDPLERIATSARVYLDFVAAVPHGWAGPLRTRPASRQRPRRCASTCARTTST
jgi:AcrR family transcriptional regulator